MKKLISLTRCSSRRMCCRTWCWTVWSWGMSCSGGSRARAACSGGILGRSVWTCWCRRCWDCWRRCGGFNILWCRRTGSHGWCWMRGPTDRIQCWLKYTISLERLPLMRNYVILTVMLTSYIHVYRAYLCPKSCVPIGLWGCYTNWAVTSGVSYNMECSAIELCMKISVALWALRIFFTKSKYPTFRHKSSMHHQVGSQGWFHQNIERFHRLGSLTEGLL